ncbi:hypothetical protein BC826DRAFT_575322 [Russula brevipes]|nr:hypothetical protein BC826DRAFT_575322 [Russula brevipes]
MMIGLLSSVLFSLIITASSSPGPLRWGGIITTVECPPRSHEHGGRLDSHAPSLVGKSAAATLTSLARRKVGRRALIPICRSRAFRECDRCSLTCTPRPKDAHHQAPLPTARYSQIATTLVPVISWQWIATITICHSCLSFFIAEQSCRKHRCCYAAGHVLELL